MATTNPTIMTVTTAGEEIGISPYGWTYFTNISGYGIWARFDGQPCTYSADEVVIPPGKVLHVPPSGKETMYFRLQANGTNGRLLRKITTDPVDMDDLDSSGWGGTGSIRASSYNCADVVNLGAIGISSAHLRGILDAAGQFAGANTLNFVTCPAGQKITVHAAYLRIGAAAFGANTDICMTFPTSNKDFAMIPALAGSQGVADRPALQVKGGTAENLVLEVTAGGLGAAATYYAEVYYSLGPL